MLDELMAKTNADEMLVWRGRWINLTFTFGIEDDDYLVTIEKGRITDVSPRRLATHSGAFSIRAKRSTWQAHWQAIPRRDFHDIWSMLPKKLVQIDGDLLPLIQNLQYFKDVIASVRKRGA